MRQFIRSKIEPTIHLEVLGFDPAAKQLTVLGRFNHRWAMELAYALKHYQPETESEHAIGTRIQEELRGGAEGHAGKTGRAEGSHAAVAGAETGSEEGSGQAA